MISHFCGVIFFQLLCLTVLVFQVLRINFTCIFTSHYFHMKIPASIVFSGSIMYNASQCIYLQREGWVFEKVKDNYERSSYYFNISREGNQSRSISYKSCTSNALRNFKIWPPNISIIFWMIFKLFLLNFGTNFRMKMAWRQ